MTTSEIRAIGNFLKSYETDLVYIRNFQLHRQKIITIESFADRGEGMFYNFLTEYKIVRNFVAGKTESILVKLNDWIDKGRGEDVDGFAESIKSEELTRNHVLTSLASKTLFLNNPWEIFPMDERAKKKLNYNGDNLYKNYIPLVKEFKKNKLEFVKDCLTFLQPYITQIESGFKGKLKNIETIRENRFIDNLLWTGD